MTEGQTTFVCCVESGWLEAQTLRMVESLRKWGGIYSNENIYAVTSRIGPPLSNTTKKAFEKLGVIHVVSNKISKNYSWFNYIGKPIAVSLIEDRVNTETICWVDSDLLFLREPTDLCLSGYDFAACASDKEMGTSGPGDPFEPLWRKNCEVLGLQVIDLPWVTTHMEQEKIRLYWNSGIFIYRRETKFGKMFLKTCVDLLNAGNKISHPHYSCSINEMSALSLAMIKMDLSWKNLPLQYNYPMGSLTHNKWYRREDLQDAIILHYHDAMWPWFWETLIDSLKQTHPEVAGWLSEKGPLKNESPLTYRILGKILLYIRKRKLLAYTSNCQEVQILESDKVMP